MSNRCTIIWTNQFFSFAACKEKGEPVINAIFKSKELCMISEDTKVFEERLAKMLETRWFHTHRSVAKLTRTWGEDLIGHRNRYRYHNTPKKKISNLQKFNLPANSAAWKKEVKKKIFIDSSRAFHHTLTCNTLIFIKRKWMMYHIHNRKHNWEKKPTKYETNMMNFFYSKSLAMKFFLTVYPG